MAQFKVVITVAVQQPNGTPVTDEQTSVTAEAEVLKRLPLGMMAQETFNELLRQLGQTEA